MKQEEAPKLVIDNLTGSVKTELVSTGENQWNLEVIAVEFQKFT